MKKTATWIAIAMLGIGMQTAHADFVFKAGDPSLASFIMGNTPYPENNQPTAARVELGQKLFFDPRLSGDGNMSCASCHNPSMGWSDGLPKARGSKSAMLGRASPTVFNTGYNSIQMWDGRKKTLEDQAIGPLESTAEMNTDMGKLFRWLGNSEGYKALFAKAYPGEPINATTLSKAIASFERTVISKNSPFDRWVRGDAAALSTQQVEGFKVFAGKGNCLACHNGPNFADNGFHNLGLASWGGPEQDVGRYAYKPVPAARGAFKTPTIREVARTAPYFHDGSAKTLMEVVEHYDRGGVVTSNLSPNIRPLGLSLQEKHALVSFMESLSSPFLLVSSPELPVN